jgi:hypothetical protein
MSLQIKAGSFVRSPTNVSQSVSGVGFTPKALIFITVMDQAEVTWAGGSLGTGIAFVAAGPTYATANEGSQDSATTQSGGVNMATAAATIACNASGTASQTCTLTSFDVDGFTILWTAGDGTNRIIGYIAIGGGPEVVVNVHQISEPTVTGNKVKTGVGFRPDVVLFAGTIETLTAVGAATTRSGFRFGMMDRDGHQYALSNSHETSAGVANTDCERAADTASCYLGTYVNTVRSKASFVSMDADGYTINFTTAPATAGLISVIAIGGVNARVGSFLKTTNPVIVGQVNQPIAGVGFQPKCLLLAGPQYNGSLGGTITPDRKLGIGVASSSSSRCAQAITDGDNIATSISKRYTDSTKVYVKVDNNSATPTIEAAADLGSFDSDGFTLAWTINDIGTAPQIGYLAIGDGYHPTARPEVRCRGANVGRKQRGAWRRRSA